MTEDQFFAPLLRSLHVLVEMLPRAFALVTVLALGALSAWIARLLARALLRLLQLDALTRWLGLSHPFAGLHVDRSLRDVLSDAVAGLVFALFFVVGLDTLDPGAGGSLLTSSYAYLPRILVAALILTAGYAVSLFVAHGVLVAAVNAGWRPARPASLVLQLLTVALALAMALEELGIAQGIVIAAFVVSFGGIVLALALAFGLAGRDLARRALEAGLRSPQPAARAHDGIAHV